MATRKTAKRKTKAKRKKTPVKEATRRKTTTVRKKPAKKAPVRRALPKKARPTAKAAVKPTPPSPPAQPVAATPKWRSRAGSAGRRALRARCGDVADNRYFGASLPPAAVRMRKAEAFASRTILSTS